MSRRRGPYYPQTAHSPGRSPSRPTPPAPPADRAKVTPPPRRTPPPRAPARRRHARDSRGILRPEDPKHQPPRGADRTRSHHGDHAVHGGDRGRHGAAGLDPPAPFLPVSCCPRPNTATRSRSTRAAQPCTRIHNQSGVAVIFRQWAPRLPPPPLSPAVRRHSSQDGNLAVRAGSRRRRPTSWRPSGSPGAVRSADAARAEQLLTAISERLEGAVLPDAVPVQARAPRPPARRRRNAAICYEGGPGWPAPPPHHQSTPSDIQPPPTTPPHPPNPPPAVRRAGRHRARLGGPIGGGSRGGGGGHRRFHASTSWRWSSARRGERCFSGRSAAGVLRPVGG